MKIRRLILLALTIFATCLASCTKDPDVPIGKVFNSDSGGGDSGGGSSSGSGTYNGHEYVDLGLPSGTLWATCNIGASSPEDYGNYYAWGETATKTTYNWNTYKYCNGNWNKLTKYCDKSGYGDNGFTDNLTELLSADDAATVNWGNGWCIPTKTQWLELRDNTSHTSHTQNGVSGHLFSASNGNNLFLPAAGCRYESSLDNAGRSGFYWSSLLRTGYNPAESLYFWFSSNGGSTVGSDYDPDGSRHVGFSVRPVRSSHQN